MDKVKKILLVDDDRIFLKMLKVRLEKTSRFEVHAISDGKRAVEFAKEFIPDLIVLDIMMPGMFGGEVATALRKDAATSSIPILFLSSIVRMENGFGINKKQEMENAASKSMPIKELILKIDSMVSS